MEGAKKGKKYHHLYGRCKVMWSKAAGYLHSAGMISLLLRDIISKLERGSR